MLKDLDPILHAQARLAIVSILMGVEEAEFVFLKQATGISAGNLSLQLNKLEEHGYIEIKKGFKNKYPVTVCKVTMKGIGRFEEYVQNLNDYIGVAARPATPREEPSNNFGLDFLPILPA